MPQQDPDREHGADQPPRAVRPSLDRLGCGGLGHSDVGLVHPTVALTARVSHRDRCHVA